MVIFLNSLFNRYYPRHTEYRIVWFSRGNSLFLRDMTDPPPDMFLMPQQPRLSTLFFQPRKFKFLAQPNVVTGSGPLVNSAVVLVHSTRQIDLRRPRPSPSANDDAADSSGHPDRLCNLGSERSLDLLFQVRLITAPVL